MEFWGPFLLGLNTMGFIIGFIARNPWACAVNAGAIFLNMAVMWQ